MTQSRFSERGRPDVIADNLQPTIYITTIDRNAVTFQITVYAKGFRFDNIITDYLNTLLIERFRKEGLAFA